MITNYYRAYAKVDLDAIKHNIISMRNHVNEVHKNISNDVLKPGEKVKVMAVIKADGYGHGAIPIGRELEKLNIDYIAVAIYQEGIMLRKEGIKTPILVLGNTPEEAYEELLKYNLAQTVYSLHMAKDLEVIAAKHGQELKVHLKIDTGMGRIGLIARNRNLDQVVEEVMEVYNLEHLVMEGIFTHFSKADETDKTYTDNQIELFNNLLQGLKEKNVNPEIVHSSNSAGLIDVGKANYNMVRAGIALYGLYPSEEVDHRVSLKPALSLLSRVVFVKEVEAGELISYGGIYKTDKKTKIATIPFGYADGYSRALSNKGRVVIHGQYAPVIGRVCMDMILVDVTHIENVEEKDEVYLIGGEDHVYVSVEELAKGMNTINYEVICLIGKRVPRVYVKENEVVETIDYF